MCSCASPCCRHTARPYTDRSQNGKCASCIMQQVSPYRVTAHEDRACTPLHKWACLTHLRCVCVPAKCPTRPLAPCTPSSRHTPAHAQPSQPMPRAVRPDACTADGVLPVCAGSLLVMQRPGWHRFMATDAAACKRRCGPHDAWRGDDAACERDACAQ